MIFELFHKLINKIYCLNIKILIKIDNEVVFDDVDLIFFIKQKI